MKVSICEISKEQEEEIVIKCHEMNKQVMAILHKLKATQEPIMGVVGSELHPVVLEDVYYFETIDNKSFLYCEREVYETKLKLYEFEKISRSNKFFRASKSTVINSLKIAYVKPSISGRFEVYMDNDEKLLVSRQYVPELKRLLGL